MSESPGGISACRQRGLSWNRSCTPFLLLMPPITEVIKFKSILFAAHCYNVPSVCHHWCGDRCLTSIVLHPPPPALPLKKWKESRKSVTFVPLKKRASPVCKSLQLQNHEPETMSNLSMCGLVASGGVIVDCNKLDTVCLTNMVPKRMNIYEIKNLMSASV